PKSYLQPRRQSSMGSSSVLTLYLQASTMTSKTTRKGNTDGSNGNGSGHRFRKPPAADQPKDRRHHQLGRLETAARSRGRGDSEDPSCERLRPRSPQTHPICTGRQTCALRRRSPPSLDHYWWSILASC